MSDGKGFVTVGTVEYFAEREKRMQARIDEAKSNIDAIETRVRAEIVEINTERDKLREHLAGFIDARNALATHHNKTIDLVAQLQAVIAICEADVPALDAMLNELEDAYAAADARLAQTEQGRSRQLKKHLRSKTKYELRKVRLDLRKRLVVNAEPEGV